MSTVVTAPTLPLHPSGQFQAVLVDVIDKGMVDFTYQGQPRRARKGSLVFQTTEKRDDGKPFLVYYNVTLSLADNARLRKFLEQWWNRPLTSDEVRDGIDLDEHIGDNAMLQIAHSKDGRYANISSIMQLPKGLPKLKPRGDYVRFKDREPPPPSDDDSPIDEEDDLPF